MTKIKIVKRADGWFFIYTKKWFTWKFTDCGATFERAKKRADELDAELNCPRGVVVWKNWTDICGYCSDI